MKKNDRDRRVPLLTKTIRIMKVTSLCNLLAVCSISASTYAQSLKFSIHKQNSSISEVFKEIEKKSDFTFFFNDNQINVKQKVSVSANNASIEDVLAQVLQNTGYNYQIIDKQILIKVSDKEVMAVPVVTQSDKKITGTVLDATGMPVIGANVMVKGTTNGTITDMDGKFSLDVEEGATLVVSYIGFANQEIKVGKQTNLSIALKEDSKALDELVVVGYGTVKKSDLTGSVGSVSMEDVNKVGITSADRALQGQVAGVQVNARSGQPGESMMIRVRGGNSLSGGNEPLYVIDGMPVEGMSSDINPEDILSMEVLKDASSTAIYGSRGANGVVMITTKRGKEGKTTVDYNGYIGVSQLRKKLDLLEKDDYIAMVNEVSVNDGNGILITPEQAALLPNNDWQDLAYQTALTHSHQFSVSGGNDKTKVYSSLNYMNQEGIIKGSNYNRFALRINGDQKIADKISLNASVAYSYGTQNTANSSADGWGAIAYTAMVMPPIDEVKNADGNYTVFSGTPWGGTNPVGMAELYKNQNINSRLLANLALSWDIIDGLNFRVNAGAEVVASESDCYIPIGLSAGGKLDGDASKSKSNYYTLINENILTYNKTFNDIHALNVMGGVTFQSYEYNSLSGSGTGFLRDVYETNNLGVATTPGIPSSGYSDYRMVSAQPTNPVGRAYGRQPKTVAKRYIIAPKVSTFAL